MSRALNSLRKSLRGVDRSRRVFAAYMVLVFVIGMTTQGLASSPTAGETTATPEPIAAEAPVVEAAVVPSVDLVPLTSSESPVVTASVPGVDPVTVLQGNTHIVVTTFNDDGAGAAWANGAYDGAEEELLGGFAFELYSGPGPDGPWTYLTTVTTADVTGIADFGMQPHGWYKVVENLTADQIFHGWQCYTNDGVKVFETTGDYNAGLWFGNVQRTSLEVYKYQDDDEDGRHDAGEPMLAGWEFTIRNKVTGATVFSGVTNANGVVIFWPVPNGTYEVIETPQDGWEATGPTTQEIVIEGCCTEMWFGNAPDRGDLEVYKYLDADGDGEYDATEEMLEDWQFTLRDSTGAVVGSGSTDQYGKLVFGNVAPGTYTVTETLTSGWDNTTPLVQEATVRDDETASLWFGNKPDNDEPELGTLIIHKFEDTDEDQVHDADEPMLEGWEFTVTNPAGPIVNDVSAAIALIGSGKTNGAGTLTFTDLDPGTLRVTETLQDGWECTTGLTRDVQIVAGQTTHVWFGNKPFMTFKELDLAITKVADDHTVDEGQLVTYTLTYWNLMTEEDAYDYTIVDDYDERYLTIVNANGGVVSDGKITWKFAGPLSAAMGKQTLTYTARVIADMPDRTTNIDNIVVIDDDRDFNYSNNRDDERIVYTPDEPFLPFTGGNYWMLLIAAATAAGIGLMLRIEPRRMA